MGNEQAIREYVVSRVTLIIDNTQSMYLPVCAAAVDAAQNDMDSEWSREAFLRTVEAGAGSRNWRDLSEVVGLAVVEVIRGWLDQGDPLHVMLGDLLDLDDREQVVLFGEHFMPEADDWPGDEEEDEDEEEDDAPCSCGRSHTRGEHGYSGDEE